MKITIHNPVYNSDNFFRWVKETVERYTDGRAVVVQKGYQMDIDTRADDEADKLVRLFLNRTKRRRFWFNYEIH